MKCYLLSDNVDTYVGMRLSGVEGMIVHERAEVLSALKEVIHREEIAVVMITEKLAALCEEALQQLKEQGGKPLLVIVPDRHGSSDLTAALSRYLAETVGIHI